VLPVVRAARRTETRNRCIVVVAERSRFGVVAAHEGSSIRISNVSRTKQVIDVHARWNREDVPARENENAGAGAPSRDDDLLATKILDLAIEVGCPEAFDDGDALFRQHDEERLLRQHRLTY
jgi:hypothetical protein